MKQLFTIISLTLAYSASMAQGAIQSFLTESGLPIGQNIAYVITDDYPSQKFRNIYLAQAIQSIPVYGSSVHVIEVGGNFMLLTSRYLTDVEKYSFQKGSISTQDAFDIAFAQLGIVNEGALRTTEEAHALYTLYNHPQIEGRAYGGATWYETNNSVKHAIFVSFEPKGHSDWHNYVIDATTGTILEHFTYTSDCHFGEDAFSHEKHENAEAGTAEPQLAKTAASGSYRVFELPIESPVHGSSALVSNPHSLVASPFGWHDVDGSVGAEYTITRGNNVHAYEDKNSSNQAGYSPDGGSLLDFDFPFTLNLEVDSILDASITNLFYMNNMLHDVMYYYGFDEASGNFQENNYTRGGAAGDYVRAESQDGSGLNNANFSTPTDGNRPRMQMYLWNRPGQGGSGSNILKVNMPSPIANTYPAVKSTLGPQIGNAPITANAVLVDDGSTNGSQGCAALINSTALAGKIAIVDRGNCTFVVKIERAQAAGAIAVIVVNNTGGNPIAMGGTGGGSITIPSVMVSQTIGNAIKAQMLLDTVNITLRDSAGSFMFDSSFDNGVVAHEYGHGISIRLTGGPSASNCLNNQEQGGEGWSDFFGLALTTKVGDVGTTGRGMAPFLSNGNTTGNGIRPARYSTSMNINPLTYGNMGQVSVPHGIGTIFASALWDMYWLLINKYGFEEDWTSTTGGNNIAMQLVIDGLKLQPCNPGFLDARDAILLADSLFYNSDNKCLIWEAFARRGMGANADQGLATNTNDGTPGFDIPASCLTASIEEMNTLAIKIYPNPAQDFVDVETTSTATIEWFTTTGSKISVGQSSVSQNLVRFETSHLPAGVYLIKIQSEGRTQNSRVIISR